jgi:hypothetical protein
MGKLRRSRNPAHHLLKSLLCLSACINSRTIEQILITYETEEFYENFPEIPILI